MKTREEIGKELAMGYAFVGEDLQRIIIIELLMDIRELLSANHPTV